MQRQVPWLVAMETHFSVTPYPPRDPWLRAPASISKMLWLGRLGVSAEWPGGWAGTWTSEAPHGACLLSAMGLVGSTELGLEASSASTAPPRPGLGTPEAAGGGADVPVGALRCDGTPAAAFLGEEFRAGVVGHLGDWTEPKRGSVACCP